MSSSPRSRALRWAAPLVVAATIGLIALVPSFSAAATPSLVPLTPEQLIAKVQQANVPALTGAVKLTTNLGIPDLGSLGNAVGGGRNGFSPTDLLSGSHEARVWYDVPDRARIALIRSMAESDVVHNGQDLWIWDSTGAKVTHFILPAVDTADQAKVPEPIKTPDQLAKDLLDQINPSTAVSVTTPEYVAGRAVYELVLQPRAAESTIDHVGISIDSATGLPLRVSIFAKSLPPGHSKLALQLGFTSVSFSRPAASTFKFTPPPGSTVTTKNETAGSHPASSDQTKSDLANSDQSGTDQITTPSAGQTVTVGKDWSTVAIFTNVQLPRQAYEVLRSATVVTGPFGSGRLVQSTLVNALVLDDGRIAVGAVTPQALEAAVTPAH
jgi:outer membrane lipoprotein-sorting protein